MVFGKLTGTAFALRFVTPAVQPVVLDHVDFFEDKTFGVQKPPRAPGASILRRARLRRDRESAAGRPYPIMVQQADQETCGRRSLSWKTPPGPRPSSVALVGTLGRRRPDAAARLAGRLAGPPRGEEGRAFSPPAAVDGVWPFLLPVLVTRQWGCLSSFAVPDRRKEWGSDAWDDLVEDRREHARRAEQHERVPGRVVKLLP